MRHRADMGLNEYQESGAGCVAEENGNMEWNSSQNDQRIAFLKGAK